MRTSALALAAFAGSALSSPLIKRNPALEVDTVYDVVYTTAYVTQTAGATAPSSTGDSHHAYKQWVDWTWNKPSASSVTQSTSSVAPTSSAVATSAAPVSTSSAAPTVESTSAYVSSSSVAADVSAASPSSAADANTASTSKATTYQQKAILHHNLHRANHSATDVTWSDALASTAKKIAESCVYAHDVNTDGGGYGQNIAAGVAPADISTVITDLFYNGEVNYFANLYGQASPDMSNFESWGHFSQIVWKATTQIGCATVDCSSGGLANAGSGVTPYFTVCNYKSPGNYDGEYATNIGKSLGKATVDGTYGV